MSGIAAEPLPNPDLARMSRKAEKSDKVTLPKSINQKP